MRRKSDKAPTMILTSDWHLREDTPIARTDDFWKAQWEKVQYIKDLQRRWEKESEWGCPVVHAGDLFHHWKPSPYLLSKTMEHLPRTFYTIYGQHDLPQHNMELSHKSGINTLQEAGVLDVLDHYHFGQDLVEMCSLSFDDGCQTPMVLLYVWHNFVWDGKKLPWPGCNELTAEQVLDKVKGSVIIPQLVVTGDHHKSFTYQRDNQLLVNPGCLTRQTADYKEHRPRVYLYYLEGHVVVPEFLPAEVGVVSRQHIQQREQHDKRMQAFISRLNDDFDTSLSFEQNLERFFSENNIRKPIKDIIYKSLET